MEESIISRLQTEFDLKEKDIRSYSPLTLAYIGDSIYDLLIRTIVVEKGNCPPNRLHHKTVEIVNATTQSELIEALQEDLTEEELTVYKRGRNAKSYTSAKNAAIQDYRKATGLEAVVGYLYLQGKTDRVIELIKTGLNRIGKEIV